MNDAITRSIVREVEPLSANELIGVAARRLAEERIPGLPAVESDGSFVGIFGEREFLRAVFPAYVGELGSSAMIRRSIDDAIERRVGCVAEPIRAYLTTDHVVVDDSHSDTQLAEIFLHHRVLIVPVAARGRVHAVVTRSDFFAALLGRLEAGASD